MKGEYDAILSWLFKMKVTFTLIDQQEDPVERQNVTKSVIPEKSIQNFERPLRKENDGREFHCFISHEEFNSRCYIVDDALFLQVDIYL